MATPFHHADCILDRQGRKTYVHWTKTPNHKALIFIHGFRGHPITTWSEFKPLLLQDPFYWDYDLFFYNYDSQFTVAQTSGYFLEKLLDEIYETPLALIKESGPRNELERRKKDFKYQKITLVAHSLGAVVSREAQLQAAKHNHKWVELSSLIFYAPAHNGARDVDNFSRLYMPIPIFRWFLKSKMVTLDDLDMTKTTCRLHQLIKEVEQLQVGKTTHYSIAKHVAAAHHEYVVNNANFLKDPSAVPIPSTDHKSVCKPNPDFLPPFNTLKSALI
jgi:pimeloyl-ACP methyl ester carboxylesterase